MNKILTYTSAILLICGGCSQHAPKQEMTQLQMREIQTRTFAAKDSKTVLKEMMNVMQDDNFIVKNASFELGLLTGEKDIDVSSGWEKTLKLLVWGSKQASWKNNCVIEISANVSQFGDDTKVRVNFQAKTLDQKGRIIKTAQVHDQQYYQEFFNKVHGGLFIQQEQL